MPVLVEVGPGRGRGYVQILDTPGSIVVGRGGRFAPLVGSVGDLIKAHLPPPAATSTTPVTVPVEVPAGGDYADLWVKQLKILAAARGSDKVNGHTVPRTTNADAVQLADWWAQVLVDAVTLATVQGKIIHEVGTTADQFAPVKHDVDQLAKAGKPSDIYAKNADLWKGTNNVAVRAATWGEAPTRWSIVLESTADAIRNLPSTLTKPFEWTWDKLERPLLIGGGVLAGLLLLTAAAK